MSTRQRALLAIASTCTFVLATALLLSGQIISAGSEFSSSDKPQIATAGNDAILSARCAYARNVASNQLHQEFKFQDIERFIPLAPPAKASSRICLLTKAPVRSVAGEPLVTPYVVLAISNSSAQLKAGYYDRRVLSRKHGESSAGFYWYDVLPQRLSGICTVRDGHYMLVTLAIEGKSSFNERKLASFFLKVCS